MKKQENDKDKIQVQIPSVGAVLMSLVALILLLYVITVVVRALSSLFL